MRFPWKKKHQVDQNASVIQTEEKEVYKILSFSETGPTRPSNEDSIIYFYPGSDRQTCFAMVADGMGGHNAGEVASSIACKTADNYIHQEFLKSDLPVLLNGLIQSMHCEILNTAKSNTAYTGMGTTATALFCHKEDVWLAHVGDSRLYRYDGHLLKQCSTDHTLVNHMVRKGEISEQDAENHEMKNILIQALGTSEKIEPEIISIAPLQQGNLYFICSDGIYDVLSNAELNTIFNMHNAALTMECIKALCIERNAKDNISGILIEKVKQSPLVKNLITREQNIMS